MERAKVVKLVSNGIKTDFRVMRRLSGMYTYTFWTTVAAGAFLSGINVTLVILLLTIDLKSLVQFQIFCLLIVCTVAAIICAICARASKKDFEKETRQKERDILEAISALEKKASATRRFR